MTGLLNTGPVRRTGKYRPTIEDIAEMSGVNSLPPCGLPLTNRMGVVTDMQPGKQVMVVSSAQGDQALYYVQKFGVKVTGIDISSSMVDISQNQCAQMGFQESAEFSIADAQALPFDDNSFDIVVNEGAVGIPPSPEKVIEEMVRVAKPGAKVCFRESYWNKSLTEQQKTEISEHYGTSPLEKDEWLSLLGSFGVSDLFYEVEQWSEPRNFWQVRPERDVVEHDQIYTPSEKLKIGRLIYKEFGAKGLETVKTNEHVFYQAVRDGCLGYGLFCGNAN